ncbi:phosphoglycolate phosphatase-like HAD superfamily hydrolase [Cytobacillus kochii]|nr:HAD hydrolase-like protein [Cytobacillus kochii]MDQ0188053.1 phosphoglycolate phosphatase-like HAD superfamily hydrolase [Cytobacillus kochii]
MTIQAVLFDFDGTLANTLPLCIYSLQEVFLKFDQRELAVKEAKEWLGNSEKKIIEEHLISNQKLEAIEYYYKVYKNNHSRLVDNNKEITERLALGKTTAHHHLKILKTAKLVDTETSKYKLKQQALHWMNEEMGIYLSQ